MYISAPYIPSWLQIQVLRRVKSRVKTWALDDIAQVGSSDEKHLCVRSDLFALAGYSAVRKECTV